MDILGKKPVKAIPIENFFKVRGIAWSPDSKAVAVLKESDLERVRRETEVHLVELDPGDVHEDEAARRLAAALTTPGLEAKPPVQSQARLVSISRGLVRVKGELIDAINALGAVSVFTVMDGQAVAEGEEVAGCKITPVAVPKARPVMMNGTPSPAQ